MTDRSERKLSAILAADVVGYSRLVGEDEEGTVGALRDTLVVLFPIILDHGGRVIGRAGDGFLAEFPSAVRAVEASVSIQRRMTERNANIDPNRRLQFRMGVNVGDVVVEGETLLGDGVNVAARLEQLAEPGGILVSGTAYDQLEGKFTLPLSFAGEHHVKNIARAVRTYNVQFDGSQAKRRTPTRYRRYSLAAAVAVLALAFIAGAWWLWPVAPAQAAPSLAVMPFENYGGDEESTRIANGVTEDIITDLARFRDLGVIARNSTAIYRGKPLDVRQVGRDLGVRYVLEGSFQSFGDQIRVSAQLIDASTGVHIWAQQYDRNVNDLFKVQSEVAESVANALASNSGLIKQIDLMAAKRKRPTDLNVYELCLLGRELRDKLTESNIRRSIEVLTRAISLDPNSARAHTELAWSYSRLANITADHNDAIQMMVGEARRAVELDPLDAEAHSALGFALATINEHKQAETEFDEALRLSPNSFDTLTTYASFANSFGEGEAGVEAAKRAMRLNPSYPPYAADLYRYAFFVAGRYEDALAMEAHQPEEMWNPNAYAFASGSLVKLGRTEEAKALAARGLARFPAQLTLGSILAEGGWSDQETRLLVETMKAAGYPACRAKETSDQASRLPECS